MASELMEGKKIGNCCIKKSDYGINAQAISFPKDLLTYLRITFKEKGMIASHRFPMYKPLNGCLTLIIFKTKRGKHLLGLASPGGAGRNKTLEQKKIVSAISTAEKELQVIEMKLDRLKEQKKGLMQQLFTGKTRIVNQYKS